VFKCYKINDLSAKLALFAPLYSPRGGGDSGLGTT